MKKITKIISVLLSFILISQGAYAHSGRTDKNGGHRDNKNVSGLGYYHYHCGGYPAHLHPNGVCPYKGGTSSNASGTSGKSSSESGGSKSQNTYVPDYFVLSNMRTFVNGKEMPTFSHSRLGGAYIIVEDLKDYGFDIDWNGYTKTVSVIKNNEKALNPLPMDYYRSFGAGYSFFAIEKESPIRVLFKNSVSDTGYSPSAYSCCGYMAISIDELKAFTEDWNWDSENLSLSLNMR